MNLIHLGESLGGPNEGVTVGEVEGISAGGNGYVISIPALVVDGLAAIDCVPVGLPVRADLDARSGVPARVPAVTWIRTASLPAQRRPSPNVIPTPPFTWFEPEKKRQGWPETRFAAVRTIVSLERLGSPLAVRVPPAPVELAQPALPLPALPQAQAVPLPKQ